MKNRNEKSEMKNISDANLFGFKFPIEVYSSSFLRKRFAKKSFFKRICFFIVFNLIEGDEFYEFSVELKDVDRVLD